MSLLLCEVVCFSIFAMSTVYVCVYVCVCVCECVRESVGRVRPCISGEGAVVLTPVSPLWSGAVLRPCLQKVSSVGIVPLAIFIWESACSPDPGRERLEEGKYLI